MNHTPSILWYDYETFGIDPAWHRPAQVGMIRTDLNLQIIDEPQVIYCKPADDFLPDPHACLITGITPQQCLQQGVVEAEFFRQINTAMSQPDTCTAGYNSLRFDDEFTRYGLYRNFFDAYAREWQNGNSRWDIIDLARMTAALRPQGINWPKRDDDGSITFRLEKLTQSNGIEHSAAHDALADVYATIALAALIKKAQPRLYDYYWQLRHKHKCAELLNPDNPQMRVHVSGKISREFAHTTLVWPLMRHPQQKNQIICYDLRHDPAELLQLDANSIHNRLYMPREERKQQQLPLIPLKGIQVNKCPALAPLNTLNDEICARIHLDVSACEQHLARLQPHQDKLRQKLTEVYNHSRLPPGDVDAQLYSHGFFDPHDQKLMREIRDLPVEKLTRRAFDFHDSRLEELLFRYLGRNYYEALDTEQQQAWQAFRQQRLCQPPSKKLIALTNYQPMLDKLLEQTENDNQRKILQTLADYPKQINLEDTVDN